jgi:hypothetical protein
MLYALVFCFSFTRSPTIILKGCIAMLMLVSRNMRAIKPNTIAPLTAKPNEPALGSKTHHEHCHKRTHKQVRNAAAEAAPCFITEIAHERLNEHTHEWWKNPEETQIVWVGSEGGEDATDVGTLKCIRNLHPEKIRN